MRFVESDKRFGILIDDLRQDVKVEGLILKVRKRERVGWCDCRCEWKVSLEGEIRCKR